MTSQPSMKMHSPAASETLGGCWKLAGGRAMTLQPREAGVLRINAGQVWATLDGPHTGPANDWGDLFLTKGQRLNLQPGQRVVIEPRGDAVNRPTYFEWEPASVEQGRTVGKASRWQFVVAGRGRVLPGLESNQP